jgi:hypothetical protein
MLSQYIVTAIGVAVFGPSAEAPVICIIPKPLKLTPKYALVELGAKNSKVPFFSNCGLFSPLTMKSSEPFIKSVGMYLRNVDNKIGRFDTG